MKNFNFINPRKLVTLTQHKYLDSRVILNLMGFFRNFFVRTLIYNSDLPNNMKHRIFTN